MPTLNAIGDYKRSGKSHKARCPAHEDSSPSLSICAAEDGKVLVNCHAGCTTEAIVTALGLEMRDLFPRADVDTTYKIDNTWKAFVRGENVTNTRYQEVANFGTTGPAIYGGFDATW